MIAIGSYNTLPVLRTHGAGVLLGTPRDHVFLPAAEVPPDTVEGDELRVFVYTDSEDEPVATTLRPHAVVGDFAFLEVVDVTPHGAFLDWGLPKDLLAPFGRQHEKMQVGDKVVVGLVLHTRTNRVIASSTLSGLFDDDVSRLSPGDPVQLMVYGVTDRGAQVIVAGRHAGLIYHDWIFRKLRIGDELEGFVERIRPDRRLDITLQRGGLAGIDDTQRKVLTALQSADGFLALHDRSPPGEIQRALGVSKKAFKRAVGSLYKARRIELTGDGIRLAGSDSPE